MAIRIVGFPTSTELQSGSGTRSHTASVMKLDLALLCPACNKKEPAEEHRFQQRQNFKVGKPHVVKAAKERILSLQRYCLLYSKDSVNDGQIPEDTKMPFVFQKPQKLKPALKNSLEVLQLSRSGAGLDIFLLQAPLHYLKKSLGLILKEMSDDAFIEYENKIKNFVKSPVPIEESEADVAEEFVQLWIENPTKVYSVLTFDMEARWVEKSPLHNLLEELAAMTCNNKRYTSELHLDSPKLVFYLMKGQQGSGFSMHTDWVDATNCVVEFDEAMCTRTSEELALAEPEPLADWWAISPEKAVDAIKWMRHRVTHYLKDALNRSHANPQELGFGHKQLEKVNRLQDTDSLVSDLSKDSVWEQLTQHLGGEDYAVRVNQCSGELVHVTPGWLHWVVNRRPCINWLGPTLFNLTLLNTSSTHIAITVTGHRHLQESHMVMEL